MKLREAFGPVVAGPIAVYLFTDDGLEHGCDVYFLMEDGQIVSLLREGFGNQFFFFADWGVMSLIR